MKEKRNTAYIALRLPQDEADAIKEAAAEAGEPVSMWMRHAARSELRDRSDLRQIAREAKDND